MNLVRVLSLRHLPAFSENEDAAADNNTTTERAAHSDLFRSLIIISVVLIVI